MLTPPADQLPPEAAVQIWFARVEAKLDVALAQHGAKLDEHSRRIADVEQIQRRAEERPTANPVDVADHEARLRVVEQRPAVSPRAMWAGAATIAGIVGAAVEALNALHR